MAEVGSARITVQEPDYKYGVGSLSLEVKRVDHASPQHCDGDTWPRVEGTRIGFNGALAGRCRVLVRARRLPPDLYGPRPAPAT